MKTDYRLSIEDRQSIIAIYRNSINCFYSGFYILSIIFLIWTIYTFSVKSCYSQLNIFSILLPINRLTIVILYRHLYIKYIEISYNIYYNGSLYFAIPDVRVTQRPALPAFRHPKKGQLMRQSPEGDYLRQVYTANNPQ